MPTPRTTSLICLLLALLFTALFHGQSMGINVLLFELPLLGLLWWWRRPAPTLEVITTTAGTLLSAAFVVLHGSDMARAVNLLSVLLSVGVLLAPKLHALHHSLLMAVRHIIPAQRAFLSSAVGSHKNLGLPRLGKSTGGTLIAMLAVVLIFLAIYQTANPHFSSLMDRLVADLEKLFSRFDLSLAATFAMGLAASNIVLQQSRHPQLMAWMGLSNDTLLRQRHRGPLSSMLGLRYELRSAMLLLGSLNLLLLVVNLLDIRHVWFQFNFNGQYLKQFVHEGTYLLILSILLGAGIVLWFFRGNQNFHGPNRGLKVLAYAWLAQNMVLAVSVGIRNYWYIHYYALAYKRIGVVFFLLAVLIGLLIVGLKVRDRRSRHFMLRWNAFAVYCILLLMASINWDVLIARYNFSKQDQSFIHLDFMATLSDKALPWLAQDQHALQLIDSQNQSLLNDSFSRSLYMEPTAYGERITERTGAFLDEYPRRSWQSWTWADARAYQRLTAR